VAYHGKVPQDRMFSLRDIVYPQRYDQNGQDGKTIDRPDGRANDEDYDRNDDQGELYGFSHGGLKQMRR